jgi:hypothetical protein
LICIRTAQDESQRDLFEQHFVSENDEKGEQYGLWYPSRYRRQLSPTVGKTIGPKLMAIFKPVHIIRLAVFYDRKLDQTHSDKRELNSFIRGILQQVQLIYRYRSMHYRFRIQVLSINLINEDPLPDSKGGEVDSYLESFCAWQRLKHAKADAAQRWDHAILLTGERLYRLDSDGQKDFKVLGTKSLN